MSQYQETIDDLSDEAFLAEKTSVAVVPQNTNANRAKLRNKIKQKRNARLNPTPTPAVNNQNLDNVLASPMVANMMKQFGLDGMDQKEFNEQIKRVLESQGFLQS